MAVPFTRWATFISQNLPKVTALFLNQLQDAVASTAYAGYGRVNVTAWSDDQSSIRLASVAPFIALDSATSQYVGVPAATGVTLTSGYTAGSWCFVYGRVTNSVVAYSISTTAPEATLRYKSGDETYRYLCAVYVNGSGYVRRFNARNGRYQYQEKVFLIGSDYGAAAGSTSWQTTYLSGSISLPPTATTMLVWAWAVSTSTGSQQAYLRGSTSNADLSSSGAPSLLLTQTGNAAYPSTADDDFEFTTSSYFQWCTSTATGMSFRALCRGFTE